MKKRLRLIRTHRNHNHQNHHNHPTKIWQISINHRQTIWNSSSIKKRRRENKKLPGRKCFNRKCKCFNRKCKCFNRKCKCFNKCHLNYPLNYK